MERTRGQEGDRPWFAEVWVPCRVCVYPPPTLPGRHIQESAEQGCLRGVASWETPCEAQAPRAECHLACLQESPLVVVARLGRTLLQLVLLGAWPELLIHTQVAAHFQAALPLTTAETTGTGGNSL